VLVTENEVLTEGDDKQIPENLSKASFSYPILQMESSTTDVTLFGAGNIASQYSLCQQCLMASEKDRGASSYTIPLTFWSAIGV